MQPTLKSHLNNKPSGIPWVDTIPSHWAVQTLRSILRPVNERNHADLPLLSVVREQGVILRDLDNTDDNHNVIPEDLSNYKLVRPKQFAINKMKAWQGSYGVSLHEGIVSPAYFVFDVLDIDPAFLHRATRSKAYVPLFDRASDGVRIGQWDLSHEHLRDIPIAIPPLNEQAAIVRYLDHADELINRYIGAKERLIALLEEQRQAVIQQAVTYGLDPDLPIKPSGIDWVDLIPAHWKTAKIQTLALLVPKSFTDGDWIESPYITSDGIRLIQTGNIGTGQYVEQGYRYINEVTFKKFNCTEIAPNDILICRLGDPVARACLAPDLGKRMITSVDVCIIKPHLGVNATFAVFVMNSPKYLGWVKSLVRGSTRDRISRSMLSKFQIPFPPLQEQDEIVDYLERVTENIDASKKNIERQIRLMHEYRTRLIADVVTGQIDVRDATVELPD